MSISIRTQLDRIINIMLTDGVQPLDLAGNIFEDGYNSVKTSRTRDCIITDVFFDEFINNIKRQNVLLRYTHNLQRQLLRVEEVFADRVVVQWDREEIINNLINDVATKLKATSGAVSESFIASLPPYLQDKLNVQLATAA